MMESKPRRAKIILKMIPRIQTPRNSPTKAQVAHSYRKMQILKKLEPHFTNMYLIQMMILNIVNKMAINGTLVKEPPTVPSHFKLTVTP